MGASRSVVSDLGRGEKFERKFEEPSCKIRNGGGDGSGYLLAEWEICDETGARDLGARAGEPGSLNLLADDDWCCQRRTEDRNLDGGEREGKTAAVELQDSFLAGPASKKQAPALIRIEGVFDLESFLRGERGASDVEGFHGPVLIFNIDPDAGAAQRDEDGFA